MAKINELTYDVREALKEYSDDTELDDRYIIYMYNVKRAKYLRQDLNNYQKTVDNSIKQDLCIELEEVKSNECGLDLTCSTLLRSVKPIPKPLDLSSKVAITNVGPADKISKKFTFMPLEKAPFVEGAPFPNSVYSFLGVDGHMYLYSQSDSYKLLECIKITGIFEDPLELSEFKNCCGCDDSNVCFDEANTEYPLQPHYIDLIREEIIKDLLSLKKIPEDKENDATDS